jgi:hypothetical protein
VGELTGEEPAVSGPIHGSVGGCRDSGTANHGAAEKVERFEVQGLAGQPVLSAALDDLASPLLGNRGAPSKIHGQAFLVFERRIYESGERTRSR